MKISKSIPLLLILGGMAICNAQTSEVATQPETTSVEAPKSVMVRGEPIHYIEKGSGEPIILIHGAIGDYNAWAFQKEALAKNHRVIAISRRYAWPNRQPDRDDSFDCTVALHAKDLEAFMKVMNIPSAHLMGHSYGAMIALRTAIDRPELVQSLVLGEPAVETMLSGSVEGDSLITDFRTKANTAVELYKEGKDEATMRQFLRMVLGSDAMYDAVPQAVRDSWLQNLVEGICISETQDLASLGPKELETLKVPTLLIKGEHSPAYLARASDSLNLVLPNSELKLLPNVSHELQGGNPEAFNAYALNFLAKEKARQELKSVDLDDGYTLHYQEMGRGEPLVFVHGSIGDHRAWAAQVDVFAKNFRVIVPSRRHAWPNAQPVSSTMDYSAGQHAKDLAELLKKLNLGPAHLVGHSWGGYTVLKMSVDHPEMVQSMVLGEPAAMPLIMGTQDGDSLVGAFFQEALAPAGQRFAEHRPEDAVRSFVTGVMGDSGYFDAVPQEMRDIWMQNTAETEGLLITQGSTPITPDEVARLAIPTLLIHGERSPKLFVKIVDTLEAVLPNNQVYELPNASHGLQYENAGEFNEAVMDFLDGL